MVVQHELAGFLSGGSKAHSVDHVVETALKELEREEILPQLPPDEAIIRLKNVIDKFSEADPEEKNRLLNTVVRRINYYKTKRMCKNKQDSDLKLTVDFL